MDKVNSLQDLVDQSSFEKERLLHFSAMDAAAAIKVCGLESFIKELSKQSTEFAILMKEIA
jgi:hypothetical protein